MSSELEEGKGLRLDFGKLRSVAETGAAVIPVVVQDVDTGAVLTLAYTNAEALRQTLERKVAVFWSTSRNELWIKGATSGDVLDLVDVRVNCEQNSLLYCVRPRTGGACHTRNLNGEPRETCYYRRLVGPGDLAFVDSGSS